MGFKQLLTKVEQAEAALEARERRVVDDWRQLKTSWKEAWTPGRIVITGLVSGFLIGGTQPLQAAARSGQFMQLATMLSGLFAGGSAKVAADEAGVAATAAAEVADAVAPGADASANVARAAAAGQAEHPPNESSPEPCTILERPTIPAPHRRATAQLPNAAPVTPRPRSSLAAVVLATIACLASLWLAQDLILPILLAMFFALIGNPIIRGLRRLWIPRVVGALLVLVSGLLATGLLANQLIEPAGEWIRQVPREIREITPKLREMTKPVRDANKAAESFARVAGGESRTGAGHPHRGQRAVPRAHRDAAAHCFGAGGDPADVLLHGLR